jgi:hypothetical protein
MNRTLKEQNELIFPLAIALAHFISLSLSKSGELAQLGRFAIDNTGIFTHIEICLHQDDFKDSPLDLN